MSVLAGRFRICSRARSSSRLRRGSGRWARRHGAGQTGHMRLRGLSSLLRSCSPRPPRDTHQTRTRERPGRKRKGRRPSAKRTGPLGHLQGHRRGPRAERPDRLRGDAPYQGARPAAVGRGNARVPPRSGDYPDTRAGRRDDWLARPRAVARGRVGRRAGGPGPGQPAPPLRAYRPGRALCADGGNRGRTSRRGEDSERGAREHPAYISANGRRWRRETSRAAPAPPTTRPSRAPIRIQGASCRGAPSSWRSEVRTKDSRSLTRSTACWWALSCAGSTESSRDR